MNINIHELVQARKKKNYVGEKFQFLRDIEKFGQYKANNTSTSRAG